RTPILLPYTTLFRSKAPVTIFYLPAFFPFVPGSAIYQTALYFIQGDYDLSNYYLIQTLSIAAAIALGVFFTDSMLEIYMHVQFKDRKSTRLNSSHVS